MVPSRHQHPPLLTSTTPGCLVMGFWMLLLWLESPKLPRKLQLGEDAVLGLNGAHGAAHTATPQ